MTSTKPKVIEKQLIEALRYRLARQPSRAGMRLSPQRELADYLQVKRTQLRAASKALLEDGTLVHRHGSGVYVRRVEKLKGPNDPPQGNPYYERLVPEKLFASYVADTRLKPEPKQAQLKLGLWWHGKVMSHATASFHEGIRRQAEDMGHQVDRLEINKEDPEEHFLRQFSSDNVAHRYDGHIILAKLATAYYRWPDSKITPAVFSWMAPAESVALQIQPLISIDKNIGIKRAVDLFWRSGFRRIGLISNDDREADFNSELMQYTCLESLLQRYVGERGGSHSKCVLCLSDPESADSAVNKLLRELPDIDALYIGDDVILKHLIPPLERAGKIPGETLPVIIHSNQCNPLPEKYDWSRMEYNPYQLGRIATLSLIRNIQSEGEDLLSFLHQPRWIPGKTHLCTRLPAPISPQNSPSTNTT